MDYDQKNNQDNNSVNKPATDLGISTASLKADILKLVEQTNDKKLLSLVWSVLQEKENPAQPLQLSRHVSEIFATYPETMQKLAQ